MPHPTFSTVGPRALIRAKHVTELQEALLNTPTIDEVDSIVYEAIADDPTITAIAESAAEAAVEAAAGPAVDDAVAGLDLIQSDDPRVPEESVDPNFVYVVADEEGNASWIAVPADGSIPGHTADMIRDISADTYPGLETTESVGLPVYAVADPQGNASWIAVNGDGSIPDHSIEMIQAALTDTESSSFVSDGYVYEWWINQAFTKLDHRYIATLYGADTGDITVQEWIPGAGFTINEVVANTTSVDDHNSPGHWVVDGERAVLLWQRHNLDNKLRIQVSLPGPDLASFADTPIVEVDQGVPVTYSQIFRIDHLSDATQNTFWCFYRHDTAQWRILVFSVAKNDGDVTVIDTYPFLSSSMGQCYCSVAESHAKSGNQTLRVAFYHNPAASSNHVWYVEVDCVTGAVTSPLHSITFNVTTASDDLEMRGASDATPDVTPALAHNASIDRRLFYTAPGPYHRRILYAEGDAVDRDSWHYYVLDLDTATTTDYGPCGLRFGYTPEANYLPGMCADNPAVDDTVYIAFNLDGLPATLERHWTTRSGPTSEVLFSSITSKPIRPYRPLGNGPYLFFYDLTSYGITGTFRSTGAVRSTLNR